MQIKKKFNCARKLMDDPYNWQAVKSLAEALLKSKELTGEEAFRILRTVLPQK